ncbi:hypothetical protein GCM10009836_55980 [Pseudonocardia ailaonensis]|uniref:DUF4282 domain-containing protein n=1 Tax=Pseudonocardia ailaonensis TaxID=367279 RepID=A0ABN2NGK6_9PSEU
MSYDPSSGDSGQQGWQGGGQQPPYPGGYGQQPPAGWGPQGPGGNPPPPGYGGPGGPGGFDGPGGTPSASGFFGALFDFNFNSFATPVVIKVLYILATIALGLGYIVAVISGFSQGVGIGVAFLIGGALLGLIYLILIRVTLEFYYAVVRMSEDIHNRR